MCLEESAFSGSYWVRNGAGLDRLLCDFSQAFAIQNLKTQRVQRLIARTVDHARKKKGEPKPSLTEATEAISLR